jgi:chemotaxis protein methyltransferase CheR
MTQDARVSADTLHPRDFQRLAAFIHSVAGIKMPPSKHAMVEGRLRRRVSATGAAGFAGYCERIFAEGEQGDEIVNLIDAVTTNKTDFFREPQHFQVLTEQVLPSLDTSRRPVKIWSAACSSGAEPYTFAMVLSDYMASQQARSRPMPSPSILATDLSTAVLRTARLGIYPISMIEPVPMEMRKRYLLRGKGRRADTVRIVPALRAMVRFGQMNLMLPSYPVDAGFDIIFCRNVLIYFDREAQRDVLRKLCDRLAPGGTLAVGHSEAVHNLDLPLSPIGHTIFRKTL